MLAFVIEGVNTNFKMSPALCCCNIPQAHGEDEAAALEQLRLFGASEGRYTKEPCFHNFIIHKQ